MRLFSIITLITLFLISCGCTTPAMESDDSPVSSDVHSEKASSDDHSEQISDDDHAEHEAHDEPRPYDALADAKADLEETLVKARKNEKLALVVMGANWCHDSRALAAHFEKERFQTDIIQPYYELLYIDVGQKDRNEDISARYGVDDIVGTPTVFILDPSETPARVLNLETAPTWRDAASREEDDIYDYYLDYGQGN